MVGVTEFSHLQAAINVILDFFILTMILPAVNTTTEHQVTIIIGVHPANKDCIHVTFYHFMIIGPDIKS